MMYVFIANNLIDIICNPEFFAKWCSNDGVSAAKHNKDSRHFGRISPNDYIIKWNKNTARTKSHKTHPNARVTK